MSDTKVPPSVRITATYPATDGSAPETIEVIWETSVPTADVVERVIGALAAVQAVDEQLRAERDEARMTVNRLAMDAANLQLERDALLNLRDKARAWAKEVRIWFRDSEVFEPTEIDLLVAVDTLAEPTEGAQP